MPHNPVARRAVLLYPVRDLHGFIVWCASYICKRSLWRDNNYELLKGGRLVARRANGAVVLPDFTEAVRSRSAGAKQ